MTDHNEPSHTGVVDPSILDTTLDDRHPDGMLKSLPYTVEGADDGGIPPFLQRQPEPMFTTETQPDGQVALAVTQGEDVLAQLPDQPEPTAANSFDASGVSGQGIVEHVSDTSEGNNDLPPTNHNQKADPEEMRKDFFRDINKFGKASGEGASALGRLGLRALRAAADGVISVAKPQGGGKDDATLIYEAYTAMDSKHAEHTAGGAKANASKLRQIIGLGCMTTISDPVAVGNRVVAIREAMEGAELKPKALFAGLVDVARAQQAADAELSKEAIEELLTKSKADKTLEKEWEAINKRIEGLVTGEASHGLKDQSEAALKISQMVAEHIKNYKADGTRQDRIADMMELGYTREMATAIVDKKIAA